jgi:hypothetical protein
MNKPPTIVIKQHARNATYNLQTTVAQAFEKNSRWKCVHFRLRNKSRMCKSTADAHAVHIIYNSGADRHYLRKEDRKKALLPILQKSTKQMRVANGNISKATNVTTLPFMPLSNKAAQADTYDNFPTSPHQWHHLNIHQKWSHSANGRRCTKNMQWRANINWSTR